MSVEIIEDDDEWEDFDVDPEPPRMVHCMRCTHPLKKHSGGLKCKICHQECGIYCRIEGVADPYDLSMCNLCNHGEHERCAEMKMIFCTCYKKGH